MSFNTYIDESIRKSFILCMTQVNSSEIAQVRKQLRFLKHPRRHFIHMQEESKENQLRIAKGILQCPVTASILVANLDQTSHSMARAAAITRAVTHAAFANSQLVTFDLSNSLTQDRQVIREVPQVSNLNIPHYRHMNSRHEPLLWLPDIIAWCYGRGGTWRDAVEPLVTEVIEL
jgi:hypothetical protein